jgi:hypothetical protein
MKTISFITHIGEDGLLQVSLPPDLKNTDLEVTLVFQEVSLSNNEEETHQKGWQKGFFEEIIGGWEGENLVREVQPDYEERDELSNWTKVKTTVRLSREQGEGSRERVND